MAKTNRCKRCRRSVKDWRRRLCTECSKTHRWCNRCQKVKPLTEFFRSGSGHSRYCRACHQEHIRRPEVVEQQKEYHYRYHLHRKFGISMEEAGRLAAVGKCQCCGAAPNGDRFHVDHDHSTGKIRGVVCRRCNFAIAVLEEKGLVKAVTRYLSRRI